ncbi:MULTISPECIES: hypothetical protein [Serratia]|nr:MULTISPECIES: hypothetical protein [Serratia]
MKITSRQLAALIQGKNLSSAEIYLLVDERHPENTVSRATMLVRLHAMLRSPSVEMVKTGQGSKARFLLISASERFLELSDINSRSDDKETTADTTLWHFHPTELHYCQLHKMFDQALSRVQDRD